MTKLWQKGYQLNDQVERFEAAQNSLLDARLIRHDVWGSLAHIAMLTKIGELTESEHSVLKDALCKVLELEEEHAFTVTLEDEDVHTCVENFLAANAGPVGKKIHMARSRNDQVLVDLRLYGKEQMHNIMTRLCNLCLALIELADTHADLPMPGYTHMQRAMLSSVGLWASSFAEALLDDDKLLSAAYQLNDQSPLGSAAGYGVPIDIDRQYCADLLGFSHVQNNVIYVQNSRGKIEAAIVQALAQTMIDLQISSGYPTLYDSRIWLLSNASGTLHWEQHHASKAQPGSDGAGQGAHTDDAGATAADTWHCKRTAFWLQHGLPGDKAPIHGSSGSGSRESRNLYSGS